MFTASGGPTPFFRTSDKPPTPAPMPVRPLARACLAEARLRAKADAGEGWGEGYLHSGAVKADASCPTKYASNRQSDRLPPHPCLKGAGRRQNAQRIFPSPALSGPPSSPINAPNHRGPAPSMAPSGEVAEWLNAPHSKCGIGASLSGVRIPPSPPLVKLRPLPRPAFNDAWRADGAFACLLG